MLGQVNQIITGYVRFSLGPVISGYVNSEQFKQITSGYAGIDRLGSFMPG
jgi:hypothetical protein